MSNDTVSHLPYADVVRDERPPDGLTRPLPHTLDELTRYAAADDAFAPPHWVRMRAPRVAALGDRFVASLNALWPLVRDRDDETITKAWTELELDPKDPHVQRFAADRLEAGAPAGATAPLFDAASHGRGARFDALFTRLDAPLSAHLKRLGALRESGGMPWSDAFAKALGDGLSTLATKPLGWALRFVAELQDERAQRFLWTALERLTDEGLRKDVQQLLAHPPVLMRDPDDEPDAPDSFDKLELGAIDPRKPAYQAACLARMAELDWARARRLATSIETEDWRLDEVVGALLNHGSAKVMADDFLARGLLLRPAEVPARRPTARELMRAGGRVVRFDTTSTEDVIDHDHLAYKLADAAGDALAGVDFLEEFLPGGRIRLHAWAGGTHYQTELDVRRSVIDPYGLVGLFNVVLRDLERPERGVLAAEDGGMCDVVVGPEKVLREVVKAHLMWIRSGFRW